MSSPEKQKISQTRKTDQAKDRTPASQRVVAKTPADRARVQRMRRKEQDLANKNVSAKRLAQLKQKQQRDSLSQQLAPGQLDTYLDRKEGKVSVKVDVVRRLRKVVPLRIVYELQNYDPDVVLKCFFDKTGDKMTFRPGNAIKNKHLSLFIALRHKPEIRVVKVNGRLAYRRGLSGSFYYRNPRGYAAIVDGMEIEVVKKHNLSPTQLQQLEKRYQISKQERASVMASAKDILGSSMSKEQQKQQMKYLLDSARFQGVDPMAVVKMLKDKRYPKGFFNLTGRESFRTLVNWTITFTATNIEKFAALTGKKAYEGRRLSNDFMRFNISGEMPAHIKLKPDAYRRWMRASKKSYVKPTFIKPDAINAKSPDEVRKLRRSMVMRDISSRKAPAESWNGLKTFENVRGKLTGKYQIPSNGIFAGSHFSSTKTLEQMRGQNVTLDLFFHGTLGYARGRMNRVMRDLGNQNRISVGVEDAFPAKVHHGAKYRGRPYYSWRNLRALPEAKQKAALITYITNLVGALEARGLKVNELTMSGHSGGGIMLHHLAKLFPSGEIPISTKAGGKRVLRIKGFFAADSHYFQNTEFFNSYLGSRFRENALNDPQIKSLMGKIGSLTQRIKDSNEPTQKEYLKRKRKDLALELRDRVRQICEEARKNLASALGNVPQNSKGNKAYTLRQIMDTTAKQLTEVVFKKALNGTLSKWQPPKYFGTGLRDWWSHQKRFHQLASSLSGSNGVQYLYKGQVNGHGQAFRAFATRAMRHFQ